jgi:hypothetical protein
MTETPKEPSLTESLRIIGFANFFKKYMSVSALFAASIPIPIASMKLIPVYSAQRGFLTVYACLICFLLIAFVFSIRHRLSVWMFSDSKRAGLVSALPMLLIVSTLVCIFMYHETLKVSLDALRSRGTSASTNQLLTQADYSEIPESLLLAAYYLGIFISAEAAFVFMAIREYLEDVLGLNEIRLLHGTPGFAVRPLKASQRDSYKTMNPVQPVTHEDQ